jgi:hypothetical protein
MKDGKSIFGPQGLTLVMKIMKIQALERDAAVFGIGKLCAKCLKDCSIPIPFEPAAGGEITHP